MLDLKLLIKVKHWCMIFIIPVQLKMYGDKQTLILLDNILE